MIYQLLKSLCFSGIVAFSFQSQVRGDLVITLTQSGSGVTASISGSGTVSATPGAVLEFESLIASPYGAGISGGGTGSNFSLTTPLVISGSDASSGGAAFSSNYGTIRLDNDGTNVSDIDLVGTFAIEVGDTFIASGASAVTGLSFTNLNPGTYSSSSFESLAFGSVTLRIVAVPEPGTASLAVPALVSFTFLRRRQFVR